MSDRSIDLDGDPLTLDAYLADLQQRRFGLGAGHDSWKLERTQRFSDPDDPAWAAFAEGKWHESIQLMEASAQAFADYCREAAGHGVTLYRIRVVEWPLRPYVQWEFHYLRHATAGGEKIRVVDSDRLAQYEENGQLPDLLTAGRDTVYQIRYSDDGRATGATRVIDQAEAATWTALLRDLYRDGEDMDQFFEREIARLRPPLVE